MWAEYDDDIEEIYLITSGAIHARPRLTLVDVDLTVLARETACAHAVVIADAVQTRRTVLAGDCKIDI